MNEFLATLENIVGPNGLITGQDVAERSDSWPPRGGCRAKCVVRPASTREVSEVLRACHDKGQAVVTQGGRTGLVGGGRAQEDEIVLSLERMTSMQAVDRVNRTVTVDAGVPLQTVQEAAETAGLLFPLDLGARGSATIGGTLSTNAGGNGVIRYGMMREQVLGLEAVLADGTVISSMKDVIKNNTGYDLKQLYVGSEGTLGVITRAVLRLRPLPRSQNTALVAVPDFERLCDFLQAMDSGLGGTLSAFEAMWNDFYSLIIGSGEKHGKPLETDSAFYVLLEATGGDPEGDAERFEKTLGEAMEDGLVTDAVIAKSRQQRHDLWGIRDDVEGLFEELFPPLSFDVSLAVQDMAAYVNEVREGLHARWSEARMVTFGHLGDGNIHLGIGVGSLEPEQVHGVESIVYGALEHRGGIVSAEHGIGFEKKPWLRLSRSPEEIDLMRTIKKALDPDNLLNPGRIFELKEGELS